MTVTDGQTISFTLPDAQAQKFSCSPPDHTNSVQDIVCHKLLRKVPGKRKVFDATWGERQVIVKLFSDTKRAKHHRIREWEGLNMLCSLKVAAPKPLFFGQDQDGRQIVVIEKIQKSATIKELCAQPVDSEKKLHLNQLMFRELAILHIKGVLQQDLHRGNFLVSGQTLFSLDPAEMKFFSAPLNRKKSLKQVALLASQMRDEKTETVNQLINEYALARGWEFTNNELSAIRTKSANYNKIWIKKSLKKRLRSCSRFKQIKHSCFSSMVDRKFFQNIDPVGQLEKIICEFKNLETLYQDHEQSIRLVNLQDHGLVVRKYPYQKPRLLPQHLFTRSPATRYWLNAHRLSLLNIPTPKPIALIEQTRGKHILETYVFTEHTTSRNSYDFLSDNEISDKLKTTVARQIIEMLDRLKTHKITHGNLGFENILVTDNGPLLTNLDRMKVHGLITTHPTPKEERADFEKKWKKSLEIERLTELITKH